MTTEGTEGLVRLNLGAGPNPMPGYVNLDIKTGTDVCDLSAYEDGSVDEIRASHVLEHVSHGQTLDVLKHWHAKLKDDGLVKIAVPDFEYIVKGLYSGSEEPCEGYLMGGQTDEHDQHRAIFTATKLEALLATVGFDSIERFESDHEDCTRLPVSLNMQARKQSQATMGDVVLLMSMPRTSLTANMFASMRCASALKCPMLVTTGVFWHQCLERIMEDAIAKHPDAKYFLTTDFDSVYDVSDVRRLRRVLEDYKYDAVCPVQVKRDESVALVSILDDAGNHKKGVTREETKRRHIRALTGHFGLTLISVEAVKRMPKPWFKELPSPNNDWGPGHIDPDIYFWHSFAEAGNRLAIAPKVKIGHAQQMVTWPGLRWEATHQYIGEYETSGPPDYTRV